tara:strand:- start:977 stop:1438 length:462 start_codon:yes stop_codon:yes gene_type:complete
MRKLYRLKLSSEERQALEALTKKGRVAAAKVLKARALLLADESPEGNGWKDPQIMEATGIKSVTLARLRQRCCEVGPLEALERKQRMTPPRAPILDGESEAKLVQLACSQAPKGHARWTLRLLADKMVMLDIVDSISHETVRQSLKKTGSSLG